MGIEGIGRDDGGGGGGVRCEGLRGGGGGRGGGDAVAEEAVLVGLDLARKGLDDLVALEEEVSEGGDLLMVVSHLLLGAALELASLHLDLHLDS